MQRQLTTAEIMPLPTSYNIWGKCPCFFTEFRYKLTSLNKLAWSIISEVSLSKSASGNDPSYRSGPCLGLSRPSRPTPFFPWIISHLVVLILFVVRAINF